MPLSSFQKTFSALVAVILIFISVLASLLAQDPQTSPSPLASVTPSVSPTPSPARTPSPTPLPGAQNFHQWGSITVFNGLPSDSVRAIAQTPDGVMWFGTDNGMARFDGRRVQNVSLGDGDANRVLSVKVSQTGDIWVGTMAGAFVYSANRSQPVDNTQGIGITSVLPGAMNYLGTDDGRLLIARRDERGALVAESIISNAIQGPDGNRAAVTSIVEVDDKLLAGTSGRGVFVVKGGTVSEFVTSPRPVFVNALSPGEDGRLWLGTDAARGVSGIFSAKANSKADKIAAPTAKVLTLESNEGGIWAGTERYGLFQVGAGKLKKTYTFANTSGGLRSDTIFALFTDREGVLWIGTNRGVSRYDALGAFQETVSDIPNSNFIRTLFRGDDGRLFAGSNRGLFELDEEKWREVPSLGNRVVYSLAENGTGTLAGASDGLFDLSGRKITDGDTRCIAIFRGRTYAAVYGRGVIDVTRNGQTQIYQGEMTTCLLAGKDRLWIGTAGEGLFSFDGKTVKQEAGPDALKSGTIWKMFEGDEGTLWIAGQHGVFRLLNGGVEQVAAVEDVRDVWFDGKDLWAATTTRGLLHARHNDQLGWLITSIAFEQGLPSEKAFSILPDGDKLVVATNRGIVTYKPGTVAPKLITVRVLSQRLHDLSETASTISLDYPQNSILVEVAGQSSRTFPEEFQYAFTLKDEKGETVDLRFSNDPQFAPTDLNPGDYTIESIAFNRDLLAAEPLTIRFSVAKAPFPWTATALAVLLAIAVVGLVWAVIEHRRIKQRNRELAAARLDLANEAERERNRIARDLHDQTLADLRKLMMRSDKGELNGSEFRGEIEAVSTEIRRICEDLSPSVLENVGLIPALEFLLTQTMENYKFSSDQNVEERIVYPFNVQLQIYRIAQEVLTNIKKHSNADLVEMKITSPEDDKILLTISDNGGDFQPDGNLGKGRGISNIYSRANLIGARVGWKQGKDGGNVFSLSIEPR